MERFSTYNIPRAKTAIKAIFCASGSIRRFKPGSGNSMIATSVAMLRAATAFEISMKSRQFLASENSHQAEIGRHVKIVVSRDTLA